MKNSYKQLCASAIVAVFLLSSCSRELTSIPKANHLANAQVLEKQQNPVQKAETSPMVEVTSPQLLPPTANSTALSTTSSKPTQIVHAKRLIHNPVANITPKQVGKEILKKANAIRHMGSNNLVASYSKTNHTEGWLGFAIACLVVGVILAILGFAELGALFWTIGIIVLVIAIVFFILWLLARAVEG